MQALSEIRRLEKYGWRRLIYNATLTGNYMDDVIKTMPPKNIRVGYQDVKITAVDLGDDFGNYNSVTALLKFNPDKGRREIVNTIIHECLHALIYTSGALRRNIFAKEDDEELVVYTLANGLTQVFLDNPALLDWIKQNLHNVII